MNRRLLFFACALVINGISFQGAFSRKQDIFLYDSVLVARQGFGAKVLINTNGVIGYVALPYNLRVPLNRDSMDFYHPIPGLEYPPGSWPIDLLNGAGLWVGALLPGPQGTKKTVTTTWTVEGSHWINETLGRETLYDSLFTGDILHPDCCNRCGFDDDDDGRIDEDPPDGLDNDGDWIQVRDDLNHNGRPEHGEPHVDEDGCARSEQDYSTTYRDNFSSPRVPGHTPLGIRIYQRSYAWEKLVKEPIIPFEYTITRTVPGTMDSVYIGIFAMIGPFVFYDYGTMARHAGYLPGVRTLYTYSQIPRYPETPPIGITYLGSSKPLGNLRFTAQFTKVPPVNDNDRYAALSRGIIDPDVHLGYLQAWPLWMFLVSVGPFTNFQLGDTLKFAFALVSGTGMTAGPNNLMSNAARAIELYMRNFMAPTLPPAPPLKITVERNRVHLDWTWYTGSPRPDPLEVWDDLNHVVSSLPDTHWRRRNPPAGHSAGGRVFEGFKLYRSDYPVFQENQLSLLKQFDIADDLGFEQQTGLQYSFTDSLVVPGRRYWYSVTSFTIPDYYVSYTVDATGQTILDTTYTEPIETPLQENLVSVPSPFSPSPRVGDVKVVPNPYRTDRDYWYEAGGWEGLGRLWTEDKRLVWFIHLPPRCTIRVFTIAGEIVKVIEHDDEHRKSIGLAVGQEEFLLLSESNRALASGIYVYLVESQLGTQMGKFVVIR